MGSLEDLRDYYKSSTKSKHLEVLTNGSTYSNAYKNEIYKRGNLIKKQMSNGVTNDIDEKYAINSNNVNFSLNKKGRWKMALELKNSLNSFADDNEEIRVYETRDRIRSSYDDCISFKSSKRNNLNIKSTYANKNSIKKNFELESIREQNPELLGKKNKNRSMKKRNDWEPEHFVIDLNENDEDREYVEYEIVYPPTMEVLKYNTLFETKKKDKVKSRVSKNILGDELINNGKNYKNIMDDYEEDFYEDEEETDAKTEKTTNISLHDLINLYTKPIVEKRKNDVVMNTKRNDDDVDYNNENKFFYIIRQESETIEKNNKQITNPVVLKSQISVAEIAQLKHLIVTINEKSLEAVKLKEKFGVRYYEAYNAWPRMFGISLNDDVNAELNRNYNKNEADSYDIKAWLIIKEIPSTKNYSLTIQTTFNKKIKDIDSIDLSNIYEFDEIYQKIIQFIGKQPLKLFKLKEKAPRVAASQTTDSIIVNDLPNIGIKSICKEIDELKYELLNKKSNTVTLSDSSSIESDNEINIKEKLDKLFETRICSCHLCFEENLPIEDCTILLNCAHEICNSCWKDYIDASINNSFINGGKLECPVCYTELELALILNFATNILEFEHYLTACIDRILALMCDYKWCQSINCNKVIIVDLSSTPYGVMSCECGYKTCLKCNLPPHFPAKCSQIAKYYSELKSKHNFTIPKHSMYTTTGKKCPNCYVFIEKMGGCNQMRCTVCKELFCWNCVNVWSEHLKLTSNQHACTVTSDKKKVVTFEFKKNDSKKSTDPKDFYSNSVYHRELRSRQSMSERDKLMKKLLETIKQKDLLNDNCYKDMSLQEKCKIEIEKRQEARKFLQKIFSFVNELHFVCEHTYVLLKDNTINKTIRISIVNIITSIETILWKIYFIFDSTNGINSLNELNESMKKGLNCLKKLNNVTNLV